MNKFDLNRKRKHRITIRLNDKEYENLCDWSTAAHLSMNDYIRKLVLGFRPIAAPPIEYNDVLEELRKLGVNMNQLAVKANSLGFIDEPEYRKNAKAVWSLCADMAKRLGKKSEKYGGHKNMGN